MDEIAQNKSSNSSLENSVEDRQFRLLVESVGDYGIFMLSPSGQVQTWNKGAQKINGYSAPEIIGQHFSKFYRDVERQAKKPDYELEIAAAKGKFEEEGWRLRKDGSMFWASVVITRLLDSKTGDLVGFGKVTRDLTDKMLAENALKESEERLRLIMENVKDYAIITLDSNGLVTSWNQGAERLKGYRRDEILGQHFSRFYEREDAAVGKCEYELEQASATGRFEDEGWRVRKDGTKFWANVVVTPIRAPGEPLAGFIKVTRDMTERKRAEDKLRMAHDGLELRVAERTKELQTAILARDQFLSIAAHELRTPLTAIKLQNQILERQMRKRPGSPIENSLLQEVTDVSGRQVVQLVRLVDDMLDTSRIARGVLSLEFERIDFSEFVSKILRGFANRFDQAHMVLTSQIENELWLRCDELRLEQVISNILNNAIKYAPGSRIDISLSASAVELILKITDSGPGMDEATQARIFERFERGVSASDVSGLGLGLFISRQIVELHRGSLSVNSALGEGATFTIRLPR